MSDPVTPALQHIIDLLNRETTTEEYDDVRAVWFAHVNNEEKLFVPHSAEDGAKALDAVMNTLIDDCRIGFIGGRMWNGQDGCRQFYDFLLGTFEGMVWEPQAVVIGPQGVLDVAQMTATKQNNAFGPLDKTNEPVRVQWVIHWPWDPAARKFSAELFYIIQYV